MKEHQIVRMSNLGRSRLSVSRFCLGSLNFGPVTDVASAHQIMDAALEAGVNFPGHLQLLRTAPGPRRS